MSELIFERDQKMEPSQASVSYASFWARVGASIVDTVIAGILCVIAARVIPVLGGLVIWFFYAPVFESSVAQATIGKKMMGIQVTDLNGHRLSLRSSTIRNLLKIVSAAVLFIGYLFPLFTTRKQALHDMLADTLGVNGETNVKIVDAWVDETRRLFGKEKTSGSESYVRSEPAAGGAGESLVSKLERLQALRDRGSISSDDYEIAKSKILSEG